MSFAGLDQKQDACLQLDVPTESEREMAEFDAWYTFGVDSVENRLEVDTRVRQPKGG